MGALRRTIREYFRLERASALAARLSDTARAEAHARRAQARQKRVAAEHLWGAGHRAEALGLMASTLEILRDAVGAAGEAPSADVAPAVEAGSAPVNAPDAARAADECAAGLRALGAHDDALASVRTALEDCARGDRALLDARFAPADEARYFHAREAVEVLDAALALLERTPVRLRRLRGARRLGWALAGAAALSALGYVVVPHESYHATASSHLAEQGDYPASNAVDGDERSEWLTPNGATGWLDVAVARPRELHAVRILNGRMEPYFDRGMREYRVEAFAGDRVVGSARGVFAEVARGAGGAFRAVPLRASGVTHVRIYCDSFHGQGCGVAEVRLE